MIELRLAGSAPEILFEALNDYKSNDVVKSEVIDSIRLALSEAERDGRFSIEVTRHDA